MYKYFIQLVDYSLIRNKDVFDFILQKLIQRGLETIGIMKD